MAPFSRRRHHWLQHESEFIKRSWGWKTLIIETFIGSISFFVHMRARSLPTQFVLFMLFSRTYNGWDVADASPTHIWCFHNIVRRKMGTFGSFERKLLWSFIKLFTDALKIVDSVWSGRGGTRSSATIWKSSDSIWKINQSSDHVAQWDSIFLVFLLAFIHTQE